MAENLEVSLDDEDEFNTNISLPNKSDVVKEQRDLILSLKRELDGVISERDLLLCEVSNLRFELEMVELKRLQDERYSFNYLS